MYAVKSTFRLLTLSVVSLTLNASKSDAASIFIDAANLPNQVAFNFGQFEGGFSINGSPLLSSGGSVFADGVPLNFTGQWIDLGAATAFSRTVYWVEPGTPNSISESFQWTVTPSGSSGLATIAGVFQAGGLGALPGGVSASDVFVKQFDGSHDPFNFFAAFLGGQVLTGPGIPEPSTLILLVGGVIGVAIRGGRRSVA